MEKLYWLVFIVICVAEEVDRDDWREKGWHSAEFASVILCNNGTESIPFRSWLGNEKLDLYKPKVDERTLYKEEKKEFWWLWTAKCECKGKCEGPKLFGDKPIWLDKCQDKFYTDYIHFACKEVRSHKLYMKATFVFLGILGGCLIIPLIVLMVNCGCCCCCGKDRKRIEYGDDGVIRVKYIDRKKAKH